MDLVRAGSDPAFEAIVERYRRALMRYVSRLLPPERAEDVVQQSFVKAYEAMHRGSAELNLKPWLYRIAHNSALNALRDRGPGHAELSDTIDGVERPDQAFERSVGLRELVVAVQALPERQRSAILLREMEGRSYEEIAAALGVSDGAVRQLLNRRAQHAAGRRGERDPAAAGGAGGHVRSRATRSTGRVAELVGLGGGALRDEAVRDRARDRSRGGRRGDRAGHRAGAERAAAAASTAAQAAEDSGGDDVGVSRTRVRRARGSGAGAAAEDGGRAAAATARRGRRRAGERRPAMDARASGGTGDGPAATAAAAAPGGGGDDRRARRRRRGHSGPGGGGCATPAAEAAPSPDDGARLPDDHSGPGGGGGDAPIDEPADGPIDDPADARRAGPGRRRQRLRQRRPRPAGRRPARRLRHRSTSRSRPSGRSAPGLASASSGSTFTTGLRSRRASRSFGSVIIFM